MSEKLPAPKNSAIEVVDAVLDALIEGAGVNAAIAAGTTAAPILGKPIIKGIFAWIVELVAGVIEKNLFKISVKLILRMQGTSRKNEFNDSIQPIINGSPTDEEIKRAREAADRLIERNRR